MKKFSTSLLIAALALGSMTSMAQTTQSPDGNTITYTILAEHGSWMNQNGNGSLSGTWQSTASPKVSLKVNTGTTNNFSKKASGPLELFAGSGCTLNITTESGWYVSSYSFKAAKSSNYSDNVTYNPNGNGIINITAEPQLISIEGLESTSTASILVGGANKGVTLTDFTVTISKAESLIVPTTIVDGKFAEDTRWYVIRVRDKSMKGTDGGDIPLVTGVHLEDEYLWCLVGNETDGYKLFNRAIGTGKALGATAFTDGYKPSMMPLGTASAVFEWMIPNHPSNGYNLILKGHDNCIVNDYKGQSTFAFWTGGNDVGSVVTFRPFLYAKKDVSAAGIWKWGQNPTVTVEGATLTDGNIILTEGEHPVILPEGQGIRKCVVSYADGSVVTYEAEGPYTDEVFKISGKAPITGVQYYVDNARLRPLGKVIMLRDGTPGNTIQYRIPAIGIVGGGEHAGRLIAVSDYRHTGCDIGMRNDCHTDLYISISDDNGETWTTPGFAYDAQGNPVTDATGVGKTSESLTHPDCAYSDPCIVGDRESGRVVMFSCGGNSGFFGSRWPDNPQHLVRWVSEDGGDTWTRDYLTDQIYKLFEGKAYNGQRMDGMFIGSGKIHQSRYVKVDKYYRLYAALSSQINGGTLYNYILYSDDCGDNWHVLGGAEVAPIQVAGDEPKCEELPDGSVLLAARRNGGNRNFNIYRFTNYETAEGYWMNQVGTHMGFGSINACNGEILIVPARNKETDTKCYLALQSFPKGPGRSHVGMAYKPLAEADDFSSPEAFTTWEGFFLVTDMSSAYSTMVLQADNKVGFLYEEDTYGMSYCEVYAALSIEQITGYKYEYCEDADGAAGVQATTNLLGKLLDDEKAVVSGDDSGKFVGEHRSDGLEVLQAAYDAYVANPVIGNVAKFYEAQSNTSVVMPEHGAIYRFTSAHNGAYATVTEPVYLTIGDFTIGNNSYTDYLCTTYNAEDPNALFTILRDPDQPGDEHFYLYNAATQKLVPPTAAVQNTYMQVVADVANTSAYTFPVDGYGLVGIVCDNPGASNMEAIHFGGPGGSSFVHRVVPWRLAGSPASHWRMEKMGVNENRPILKPGQEESSISDVTVEAPANVTYYDLQGRKVASPVRGGIYITSDRRKVRI